MDNFTYMLEGVVLLATLQTGAISMMNRQGASATSMTTFEYVSFSMQLALWLASHAWFCLRGWQHSRLSRESMVPFQVSKSSTLQGVKVESLGQSHRVVRMRSSLIPPKDAHTGKLIRRLAGAN
tara:strand:- start:38 stop:409 length:372 start_codon:yes stop_codon:yes gene_type:complete